MTFDISATWLVAVLLVTIRMGILFYATPFDAMGRLPVQIRIYASFLFAVMLVTGLDISALAMPQSMFELAMFGVQEAFIGLVMAFVQGIHLRFIFQRAETKPVSFSRRGNELPHAFGKAPSGRWPDGPVI